MESNPAASVDSRPVVGHCMSIYLPITETWIYSQLVSMCRYRPVVFADSVANVEQFPFDAVCRHDRNGYSPLARWGTTLLRRVPQYPLSYVDPFRQHQVQLLHAHFGDEGFRMLAIKARLQVPLVVTFYGFDVSALPRRGLLGRWRLWLKVLFRAVDRVLAEGPFMRQSLVALGCPSHKAIVQHLGVDVDRLPFACRSLPADGPVRFLIAATFREKKGIAYGLEAFARVAAQRSQLELLLVGDGPLRPQIERQISELGLGEKVKMLGYQSHEALIDVAMRSHIVMAPSVTANDGDTEGGAPVFLIEAQAMGLPILATRHADIPEVVRQGESGFLTGERDVPALVERLEYLLDHAGLWPQLGIRGREHARAEFSLDRQITRLEHIYDEVLDHHGRRSTRGVWKAK